MAEQALTKRKALQYNDAYNYVEERIRYIKDSIDWNILFIKCYYFIINYNSNDYIIRNNIYNNIYMNHSNNSNNSNNNNNNSNNDTNNNNSIIHSISSDFPNEDKESIEFGFLKLAS